MKPTDEQLRDPKWWDENAPKGATHFARFASGEAEWQKRLPNKVTQHWDERVQLWDDVGPYSSATMTLRPTMPAAPEWDGDGYPPVGCECECITEYGYLPCKVVDHGHDYVVVHFYKNEHNLKVDWTVTGCRPLRTKGQRQREELQEIISDAYESGVGVIAAEIIAAGWTKEKQDD